jgi:haloalkane dehalogenase
MKDQEISAQFPFESKYLEVKGSKIHYIDEGEGDPILFLHGNPTSNYLWRNIIPYVKTLGRCIAPDLIGMGKSDKPDISYGFQDTYEYLEEFIEGLDLKNITIVVHDWGSGLGFHYANTHRDNIKGVAFMEAMVKPLTWNSMPSFGMQIAFRMMRAPFIGWGMVNVANIFVKKMLPSMIVRKLSKEETDYYEKPYPTISSRKPLRVWPKEVPINGAPKQTYDIIHSYGEWLKESNIPKLFFYASLGAINQEDTVDYVNKNFSNLKSVDIGKGLHYIQEDNPHLIGQELAKWFEEL